MSIIAGKKILVVDDEEMIQEIFRDELESLGALVETAGNGQIGLQKASANLFDLILTDFKMPICDGLTMSREIRKIQKSKPIIILCTAFAKDLTEQARQDAGICKVVEKPFDLVALTGILESCFLAPK